MTLCWYKVQSLMQSTAREVRPLPRHHAYLRVLKNMNRFQDILSVACGDAWTERHLGIPMRLTDSHPHDADIEYFDVLTSPLLSSQYDAILCFSFFYCLHDADALRFLRRMRMLLKPTGVLILDAAGPAPSFLVWIWNHVIVLIESWLVAVLRGQRSRVRHHGYWRSDKTIMRLCETVGICRFQIHTCDYESELSRCRFYTHVLSRWRWGRVLGQWLGSHMPYVRLFFIHWEHPQRRKWEDERRHEYSQSLS